LAFPPVAAPPPVQPPPRTNVYIDGFNFYYGAVKNTPYRWLDFDAYVRSFRSKDDIRRIYYFTARVDPGPHRQRQDTFLLALATRPCIEIVEGKFLKKSVQCRVAACVAPGNKVFQSAEEKRTDVNIAVYMLDDAYQDACDQFVLISGDSDLVPAIKTIKQRFPQKKVIVYVPSRGRPKHGYELRMIADHAKEAPLNVLGQAQFPPRVPDGSGAFLVKPVGW
jgi:6-hydroxy-3-succinoylpyridine 3-monooxygenase